VGIQLSGIPVGGVEPIAKISLRRWGGKKIRKQGWDSQIGGQNGKLLKVGE